VSFVNSSLLSVFADIGVQITRQGLMKLREPSMVLLEDYQEALKRP
jgi:hypothetical protein